MKFYQSVHYLLRIHLANSFIICPNLRVNLNIFKYIKKIISWLFAQYLFSANWGGIALNNNSYLMGLAKGETNKCYGRAGMVPSDINGRDGGVWGENHPFPLTHTFISSSSLDGLMGAVEVICSLTHCRKQNIKYFHNSTARLPQAFLLNWTSLELKSTNMFYIMRCKELSLS